MTAAALALEVTLSGATLTVGILAVLVIGIAIGVIAPSAIDYLSDMLAGLAEIVAVILIVALVVAIAAVVLLATGTIRF